MKKGDTFGVKEKNQKQGGVARLWHQNAAQKCIEKQASKLRWIVFRWEWVEGNSWYTSWYLSAGESSKVNFGRRWWWWNVRRCEKEREREYHFHGEKVAAKEIYYLARTEFTTLTGGPFLHVTACDRSINTPLITSRTFHTIDLQHTPKFANLRREQAFCKQNHTDTDMSPFANISRLIS